jgi:hypothetical protein
MERTKNPKLPKGDAVTKQAGAKRDILAELMEGVAAMGERRAGKVAQRTQTGFEFPKTAVSR